MLSQHDDVNMLNKHVKKNFIIAIFSLGKIIAASGQTLFTARHALSYMLKNVSIDCPTNIISGIFAGCTLFIISITRVPAIRLQFGSGLQEKNIAHPFANSCCKKYAYHMLVCFNSAAGVFSSIGAYLGTVTIVEFISGLGNYHVHTIFTQAFAILVAISSFASYYSFNIRKAKINSIHLIEKINFQIPKLLMNKIVLKTMIVSFLNVASVPFIAYFLTRNALYKMPYMDLLLSAYHIKWIAAFSAFTALIANLTTTVAAMHEYFIESEKEDRSKEPAFWLSLRYITYAAGLIDSSANGLGNFLGVITISHDVFNTSLYNDYIILIAIGCGMSATLLNLAFSIRQGFNDVANYYQRKVFVT